MDKIVALLIMTSTWVLFAIGMWAYVAFTKDKDN